MTQLSPRQREILALVAAGRTSKEIASDLGIAESTVNWHISNVFGRLGASSRAEAVALAMREEAEGPQSDTPVAKRPARRPLPPLPVSSVALAVALTLVLGLLGGALMAGWQFTSPLSPSASAAPHSADPSTRPAEIRGPSSGPSSPTPTATPTPAAIASTSPGVPAPSQALPIAGPTVPLPSRLPAVTAPPTLPAVPSVPLLRSIPLIGR